MAFLPFAWQPALLPTSSVPAKKSIHSTADLARHLGLSRWSVSRAINGQGGVSAETTGQVRAAMEKFGFTPSAHGRGLRGHRTGAVGICFRTLDTPITIEKIGQVQRLISEHGYRPLFELTELSQQRGHEVINHFISLRVEGVLFVDTQPGRQSTEWQRLLKRHGIPAAHLEPLGAFTHNAVHLDRMDAMATATRQLLDLGHDRFAMLGISRESALGGPRFDGIVRALVDGGKDPERCLQVLDFPHTRPAGLRYGHELATKLLELKEPPTALLAVNDEVAAGLMWGLQHAGCMIPRDFSVFGFDNSALSEQTMPALCTIDHDVTAIARAAVALMLRLVQQGAHARVPVVKIAPKVIFRESAGPR